MAACLVTPPLLCATSLAPVPMATSILAHSLWEMLCSILQEMSASSTLQGVQVPTLPLSGVQVPYLPASGCQVPLHPSQDHRHSRSTPVHPVSPGPLHPLPGFSPPMVANAQAAALALASSRPSSPVSISSDSSSPTSHASQRDFLYILEVNDQVVFTCLWAPLPESLWRVAGNDDS